MSAYNTLKSHWLLQMASTGLPQGLEQPSTQLQPIHKCVLALQLALRQARCGLERQWRLHMLTCASALPLHLEQQDWEQLPLVKEGLGL